MNSAIAGAPPEAVTVLGDATAARTPAGGVHGKALIVPLRGDDVVARAKQGDQEAWAALYGDNAHRLVVWLRHLPHPDAAADPEDVAGEAWLTAARRIMDFSGDRNDFAGWLFAIARNIALARHRTTARRATDATDPELVDRHCGAGAPDPAVEIAAADATRRLIAHLPAREAQVVACIDVVGLDVASTSIALGMTSTAVRVAHHRGLGRLRRILVRRDQGRPPDDVTFRAGHGM